MKEYVKEFEKIVIDLMIEKHGEAHEIDVCMEECAELIQAISKMRRYDTMKCMNHMIEEIADVLICIEMLKTIYEISDADIERWIEYKSKRNLKRIVGDKEHD